MSKIENFTIQEVPYDILRDFGLTQQMIDDLPQSVTQKMLSGKVTPLLPITTERQDGGLTHGKAGIRLIRMEDGTVNVFFYPKRKALDLEEFPNLTPSVLMKGKVFRTQKGFAQYDEKIQQMMTISFGVVLHNIEVLQTKMNLTSKQRDLLLKGKIVEIGTEDKKMSIGIDIKEEGTLRISRGDTVQWEKEADINALPQYNFGTYGCWVNQEDEDLKYILQEDYEKHPDVMTAWMETDQYNLKRN